jgi:VWFA-related protein
MRRRWWAWLFAVVAAVPVCAQVPTFRSGTNAVMVDVSVRDRARRVVTRLGAADFQVFDNGVLQEVDSVSYGKLPIDVTVALDVSYSVTGDLLARLRRGVVQLMRDLAREDRLKLVLFNMRVNRIVDFTSDVAAVEHALQATPTGGGTALLDAVSVALVSQSMPDRRQLVMFFTDGRDSSSITTPEALLGVAQRTRATLAFVMPAVTPRFFAPAPAGGTGVTIFRSTDNVRIAPRPLEGLFATLARETGGSILPVSATADLSSTFRRVLEDFRSAYVLYYVARGVDRAGYHAIEVKVKLQGATVLARRGYFGG